MIKVNFFSHTHVLYLLIQRELASRYKGTMMGVLWLFLQPLAMVLVYSFVFPVIMKVRVPGIDNSYHFSLYLMAALIPFTAFKEAITMASNSLLSNSALLHKSTIPAWLLPLVPMLTTVITESIMLMMLIVAAYFLLDQVSFYLFLLPLLIMVRLCFSLALGYFIAVLSVFIQDLRQGLNLIFMMLMFLTPIFYPVEMVPAKYQWISYFNPLFHIFDAYRAIVIRGVIPNIEVLYVAVASCLLIVLGVYFFQKTISRAKDFI